MTYHGKIKNGVVELSSDARLPEGADVIVEVIQSTSQPDTSESAYAIGELAADTGVGDLSVNLDHYLYGHAKKPADGECSPHRTAFTSLPDPS